MGTLLITEENAEEQIRIQRYRISTSDRYTWRGCIKDPTEWAEGDMPPPSAATFPRIPRTEWKGLIRQHAGNFLGDTCRGILPVHDQERTNYCWAHGSVTAVEMLRIIKGQKPLLLSAESVAVPVTGGRNRGGSPGEAMRQLRDFGCCEQSYWPKNSLNEKNAKEGWKQNAQLHRLINWVAPQNFDDQMTLALHRLPVAIGLGWWGHLVCQIDPIFLDDVPELDKIKRRDGEFGIGCLNSYGPSYGDNGYFYLIESKGTADLGAFAPISVKWRL